MRTVPIHDGKRMILKVVQLAKSKRSTRVCQVYNEDRSYSRMMTLPSAISAELGVDTTAFYTAAILTSGISWIERIDAQPWRAAAVSYDAVAPGGRVRLDPADPVQRPRLGGAVLRGVPAQMVGAAVMTNERRAP
jgi:hypothetical protein